MFQFYISYWVYLMILCLPCGLYTLKVDAKKYSQAGMTRETRASRILAWANITAGALVLLYRLAVAMLS